MCSVYTAGSNPVYDACTSPYVTGNLINGRTYIFSVIPTDGVGNVGTSINYTWRIGNRILHSMLVLTHIYSTSKSNGSYHAADIQYWNFISHYKRLGFYNTLFS